MLLVRCHHCTRACVLNVHVCACMCVGPSLSFSIIQFLYCQKKLYHKMWIIKKFVEYCTIAPLKKKKMPNVEKNAECREVFREIEGDGKYYYNKHNCSTHHHPAGLVLELARLLVVPVHVFANVVFCFCVYWVLFAIHHISFQTTIIHFI